MDLLKGIPVSSGIVIGRVFVLDNDLTRVPRRRVSEDQVPEQQTRLTDALAVSVAELERVYQEARREMGDEAAKIFLFHIGMLRDRNLIAPMEKAIAEERYTAEYAVSSTFRALSDRFAQMGDSAFTTKVNDLADLSERLLKHLIGERRAELDLAEPGTVVVARDLTPSQTVGFNRKNIAAIATDLGGRTGHTSIVARALGLPAVVGCQGLLAKAINGQMVIVDGDSGRVLLDPDPEQITQYQAYIEQEATYRLSLRDVAALESITRDGVGIEILGNIEFPEEIPMLLEAGAAGVGLYRTEFLYLTQPREPTEDQQFEAYKACVEALGGRPLTIRTLDLGADKYTQERADNPERNPFLGLRSIRYCLRSMPMFKRQLRALARASAFGAIKIMFPLVTNIAEVRQARFLLNDIVEDLSEEGIAHDPKIPIGMMVEVPAAALMASAFAREVDFFSIGTNDLVQYTLAADRTNEQVASYFAPMHPAVMRLIREVVKASRRHDVPLSCCGESAGEVEFALLLIGLGVRTLSVSAPAVPNLKRLVRSVSITECERIAKQALTFDSDTQVAGYLRDRARRIVPEAFDGRAAE
ncbi:MAG: phosphoenolpyruvate--protein phosphotransferase [Phycisphaerales bacterium]|nr:phosphoenolpyruvate--protein phosphotransferase [Phycisphaerales bacterium]